MSVGKSSINRATRAAGQTLNEQKFYDASETEAPKLTREDKELEFISTDLLVPSYDEQSVTCKSTFVDVMTSVKNYGILIPLLVRKVKDGDNVYYRVLSGHKRLFAAKQVGLKTVPALIITCSDRKAASICTEIEKYDSKSKFYEKPDKIESKVPSLKQEKLPNYLL